MIDGLMRPQFPSAALVDRWTPYTGMRVYHDSGYPPAVFYLVDEASQAIIVKGTFEVVCAYILATLSERAVAAPPRPPEVAR